jgi:predicted DNA-binding ribbon-helix-helix protein
MSSDPNKKSARSFQCRDILWDAFQQMAQELECSVDYLINEAMKVHHDNVYLIPIHLQVIPWASRSNVTIPHRADNNVRPDWTTVKQRD